MQSTEPSTPAQRMRTYRAKLRAQGLRPIQIWVPDVNAPGFVEELKRQCRLAANHPQEKETSNFLEAAYDLEGW